MDSRISSVASKFEFESQVNQLIARGYKFRSRTESTARLTKARKQNVGIHILLALLTWWLFFVGNIIYAIVKMSRPADDITVIHHMQTNRIEYQAPGAETIHRPSPPGWE